MNLRINMCRIILKIIYELKQQINKYQIIENSKNE